MRGRISYVNDQFCAMSGFSRDELMGQNLRILNCGLHAADFFANVWRTFALV
ncbi:PAS domain-containing protein, partial [Pseudomonas sp. DC1.2]|uniref:PAS domain-containing protein n=1 Tax=Pseudomonas sp. DC1.2 TaxID=3048622 RepID=UPI002B23429B